MMLCIRTLSIAALVMSLNACTWVKLTPGADNVDVADASAVSSCESRGTISASVLDKVGPMARDPFDIQKDLTVQARNSALELGADTIVSNGPEKDGKGTFNAYKCRK